MRNSKDRGFFFRRRTFISNMLKAAGVTALDTLPGIGSANPVEENSIPKKYTVQDIMDLILKEIPEAPLSSTVDTLKSGTSSMEVTGIVTTMFATVRIIRQAVKLNANFIIAHEPTFYNHLDDPAWVADNAIANEKRALLLRHGITVWRFHDYWHLYNPDGILHGVLQKTGWLKYYRGNEISLMLPGTPLKKIVSHLKSTLGIDHLRVIGDPEQSCQKITLLPGASGGQQQVAAAERDKPDLLIVGELQEWKQPNISGTQGLWAPGFA